MVRSPFNTKRVTSADFSAADAELEGTLDNLDGADNYAAWIFGLIEPYTGQDVLEIGSGHGTFTEILARESRRVVASDLSTRCTDILKARFADEAGVEILHGSIEAAGPHGPFDSAVLINVLEHIEDDETALVELFSLLRPGGRLLLWVPAFEVLYSDFDRKIGHHRRYRKSDLGAKLTQSGYEVHDIRYVNAVGAVAWLIVARLLRRTPTSGGSVKVFDRYFVPTLRRIEGRFRAPFGQSVFAVAIRPLPRQGDAPLRETTSP